jgi:hypothetical protein
LRKREGESGEGSRGIVAKHWGGERSLSALG